MARIDYEVLVDTDEPERKLTLMRQSTRLCGTI
jgi:hypothetical protein